MSNEIDIQTSKKEIEIDIEILEKKIKMEEGIINSKKEGIRLIKSLLNNAQLGSADVDIILSYINELK